MRRLSGLAGVMALGLALAGCGTATTGTTMVGRAAPDEVADHPAGTCPVTLPIGGDPGGHGFGVDEDATETPDLPAIEHAWICRYDPVDTAPGGANGATLTWTSAGEVAPVGEAELPAFSAAFDELAPRPPGDHACNADLGPRWLVAWTSDRDLTGAVVEGYGCADVRLTDQPFTTPAGEASAGGVVPGVLPSPTHLLRAIQAVVGAQARFHALLALDSTLDLPCAESVRRRVDLDVPGPGRPDPEQAARAYADGDRVVMAAAAVTDDTAEVNVIGSDGTLRRVVLLDSREDGWWPAGYLEC